MLKGGGTTTEMISSGLAGVSSGTEQTFNQMLGLKPKTGRGQPGQFFGAGGSPARISNAINRSPIANAASIIQSTTSGNVPILNAIDNIFGTDSSGTVSKIANKTPFVGAAGRYFTSTGEKAAALPGVGTGGYTPGMSPGAVEAGAGGSDAAYLENEYALRYPSLNQASLQQAKLYENSRNAYNKGRQNVANSRQTFENNKAVMQKMLQTGRHPNGNPLSQSQLKQYHNNLQNQANEIKRREQAVMGNYNAAQGIYNNLQNSNAITKMNQDSRMSEEARRNKLAQTGRAYMLADSMLPEARNLSKGEKALRSAAQLTDAFVPATGGLAEPIVRYGQSLTRLPEELRRTGQTDRARGTGEIVPSLNPSTNPLENFGEMTGENLKSMVPGANPLTRLRQAGHYVNELGGFGDPGRALLEPINAGAGALNYATRKTINPVVDLFFDSARNPKGTGELRGGTNVVQRGLGNLVGAVPLIGPFAQKYIAGSIPSGVAINTAYEQAQQDKRNRELYGQDYADARNNEAEFISSRTAPAQSGPLTDPTSFREYMGAETPRFIRKPSYSGATGVVPGMMLNERGNMVRATPGNITQRASYTPPSIIPPMATSVGPTPMIYQPDTIRYGGFNTGTKGGITIPGNMSRSVLDSALSLPPMSFTPRAIGVKPGTSQFDGTMLPGVPVGFGGKTTMPSQPMMSNQERAALQSNMDAAFAGRSQDNRNAPIKTDRGLRNRMAQTQNQAEGLTPAQYNQLLERERMIMHQATKRRLTDGEKTALRVARQQRMQEDALREGRIPAQRELTNRELVTMRQQSEPGFIESVTQGGLFNKKSREQFNRLDAQRPTGIQRLIGGARNTPQPQTQPQPNMIGLGSMAGRELPIPNQPMRINRKPTVGRKRYGKAGRRY